MRIGFMSGFQNNIRHYDSSTPRKLNTVATQFSGDDESDEPNWAALLGEDAVKLSSQGNRLAKHAEFEKLVLQIYANETEPWAVRKQAMHLIQEMTRNKTGKSEDSMNDFKAELLAQFYDTYVDYLTENEIYLDAEIAHNDDGVVTQILVQDLMTLVTAFSLVTKSQLVVQPGSEIDPNTLTARSNFRDRLCRLFDLCAQTAERNPMFFVLPFAPDFMMEVVCEVLKQSEPLAPWMPGVEIENQVLIKRFETILTNAIEVTRVMIVTSNDVEEQCALSETNADLKRKLAAVYQHQASYFEHRGNYAAALENYQAQLPLFDAAQNPIQREVCEAMIVACLDKLAEH